MQILQAQAKKARMTSSGISLSEFGKFPTGPFKRSHDLLETNLLKTPVIKLKHLTFFLSQYKSTGVKKKEWNE